MCWSMVNSGDYRMGGPSTATYYNFRLTVTVWMNGDNPINKAADLYLNFVI